MPRVPLNETQDLPETHRWIFERIEQRGGSAALLNIFRALSHSPEAMRRFMKFGSYFLEEGKLDPNLRELAILRAGLLCGARYEFSHHVEFARRAGLSDDEIRGVADPLARKSLYTPQQFSVLKYAGELTQDARVAEATYAECASFLSDEQLVELTLVVGFYNMVSRALNALEIEPEPHYRKLLDEIGIDV